MSNCAGQRLSVLIPDGESGNAINVTRCFSRTPAIKAHILSTDRWAVSRFSRHRSRFVSRPNDNDERIATICETARRLRADIILPVDEPTIRMLSQHRDTVSQIAAIAPLPETAAFDAVIDKSLFADVLRENRIPHPPTIVYRAGLGAAEIADRLSALSFPVLTKPVIGAGGVGIRLFEDPIAVLSYLRDCPPTTNLVVQSFINGYDIDCSVLCRDGNILAYTIQKAFMDGYQQFACSAAVEFLHHDEVYGIASQLMRALKWSGIAHIDMRFDVRDGRIKVLEINPRFWRTLLGSLCAGVNFPYLACLAGLGIRVSPPAYTLLRYVEGKAAIRLIPECVRGLTRKSDMNGIQTSIEFALRDPLPYLFVNCKELRNGLMRRVRGRAFCNLYSTLESPLRRNGETSTCVASQA